MLLRDTCDILVLLGVDLHEVLVDIVEAQRLHFSLHQGVDHAALLRVLHLVRLLLVMLLDLVAFGPEVLLDGSDVCLDGVELLLALLYFVIHLFLEVLLDLLLVLLMVTRLNQIVLPLVAIDLGLPLPKLSNVRHLLQLTLHGG